MLLQSFGYSLDFIYKLNEIYEHAEFHKAEYGDDLVLFLSKHYGEQMMTHQEEHKEEQGEHEELPFKQLSNSLCSTIFIVNAEMAYFTESLFVESYRHTFMYKRQFSSIYKDTLLRPPRMS